jgi:hypothetical protein
VNGTGKFKGIKASGTCKGTGTPEGGMSLACDGTYSLPKQDIVVRRIKSKRSEETVVKLLFKQVPRRSRTSGVGNSEAWSCVTRQRPELV